MKITRKNLEKLIVEEINAILSERSTPPSQRIQEPMKLVKDSLKKGKYDAAVWNLTHGVMPIVLKFLDYVVEEVEKQGKQQ